MSKPRANRQGYVLIMALVIIGLSGLALARLANRSLALSLDARRSAVQLQQRWATLSCQNQVLRNPDLLFGDLAAAFEEDLAGWPHPARISGSCNLGGVQCDLLLSDEQAKVNINEIYAKRPELLLGMLGQALNVNATVLPLRLRPHTTRQKVQRNEYFSSWGQVVDMSQLRNSEQLIAISTDFTCWGDRRLNTTRASDSALDAVARIALTGPEVRRLLEAREGFEGTLDELFRLADLPRRKAALLRRSVTLLSNCYSLWLKTSYKSKQKLTVTVSEAGNSSVSGKRAYAWP